MIVGSDRISTAGLRHLVHLGDGDQGLPSEVTGSGRRDCDRPRPGCSTATFTLSEVTGSARRDCDMAPKTLSFLGGQGTWVGSDRISTAGLRREDPEDFGCPEGLSRGTGSVRRDCARCDFVAPNSSGREAATVGKLSIQRAVRRRSSRDRRWLLFRKRLRRYGGGEEGRKVAGERPPPLRLWNRRVSVLRFFQLIENRRKRRQSADRHQAPRCPAHCASASAEQAVKNDRISNAGLVKRL